MAAIQFFQGYEKPIRLKDIMIKVEKNNFSEFIQERDRKTIDEEWKTVTVKNNKAFSKPGGLGCLSDTQNEIYRFTQTEFKHYVAISRT